MRNLTELLCTHNVVLLQFGSETCAPCAAVRKKIEEWSRNHEAAGAEYISIEECPELAAKYGVFSAPTVLLFVEGKLTVRESGYFSLDEVFRKAERYIKLMDPVIIRSAAPGDAERLLEIYAYYIEKTAITFEYDVPSCEEFRARIEKTLEKYPYLVLLENGVIKGYAYAGVFKNRAAYDRSCEVTIYLDHGVQGRGYGRKLYEALEEELKARGILNMYACIGDPIVEDEYLTKNSEHFHQHLGFRKVGEFHKCGFKFNRWYNMIWMEKMIGEHT